VEVSWQLAAVKLSISVNHVIMIFQACSAIMRHNISINIFTLQQIEECKDKYREYKFMTTHVQLNWKKSHKDDLKIYLPSFVSFSHSF
jgi:hypothetical protein